MESVEEAGEGEEHHGGTEVVAGALAAAVAEGQDAERGVVDSGKVVVALPALGVERQGLRPRLGAAPEREDVDEHARAFGDAVPV